MTGHDPRRGVYTRRARADSYDEEDDWRARRVRSRDGEPISYDKTDKNVYLVRVAVRVAAAADCAVLVVEEHETDGDDADDERQEAHRAKTRRSGAHRNSRHTLRGSDLQIDSSAKGEQKSVPEVVVTSRSNADENAEDDAHAGDEVHEQRAKRREIALEGIREYQIVGELLRDFVIDGRGGDRPSHGLSTVEETESDEDAIHEVVHEISENDAASNAILVRVARFAIFLNALDRVLRVGRLRLD